MKMLCLFLLIRSTAYIVDLKRYCLSSKKPHASLQKLTLALLELAAKCAALFSVMKNYRQLKPLLQIKKSTPDEL